MRHRPSMRPDFELELEAPGARVFDTLRQRLRADPLMGEVLQTHAYVRLPREERSLLSPNLNLDLLYEGERTRLRGRFTPHPSVWMGFMAVFCTLGMIGLSGLMYGFAQMTVDETPWALLAAPVSLALIAFVYGAAFIGQGLSADEMYRLRAFVDDVLREASEVREPGEPGHAPVAEAE